MNKDRTVRSACLAAAAFLLAGCAGQPSQPTVSRAESGASARIGSTRDSIGSAVASLARSFIGVPYTYGGADPSGFDCSGLVFYTYHRAGVDVPRTSIDQFRASRKIAPARAAAGDLVFFQDQEKLSHVGIYLGDGLFVHAPTSGRTVSIASLEAPYYQTHLVAVGRLAPN